MAAGFRPGAEFSGRVSECIDVALVLALDNPQKRRDVGQTCRADHNEVHVAQRVFPAARHGPIDERDQDAIAEPGQRLPKRLSNPQSLLHDPVQLVEKGQIVLGLVVDALAITPLAQDAALREGLQLSLEGRRRGLQMSGQFCHVPPSLWLPEGRGQQIAPRPGKQGINRPFGTHNAYMITQKAYRVKPSPPASAGVRRIPGKVSTETINRASLQAIIASTCEKWRRGVGHRGAWRARGFGVKPAGVSLKLSMSCHVAVGRQFARAIRAGCTTACVRPVPRNSEWSSSVAVSLMYN